MKKLEIAAFNLESAIIAEQAGADRVELCKQMELGGTTPDMATFIKAKQELQIDIYVMIRPRGGNFCYTEEELNQMLQDIANFKENGSDGFVFGILTEDDEIDTERNKVLVAAASPLPCTFHRAFDRCKNQETALDKLISCGFSTVLTSGFSANVDSGINYLSYLVQQAGSRITIMPGGGLRAANLANIIDLTKAFFYHSSGIREGLIANSEEIQKMATILKTR